MQFNITKKLFLITLFPVFALLLFSLNHINEKYQILQSHSKQLAYSKIMYSTSNLMHEMQIERGLSSGYINNIGTEFFEKMLETHYKTSDREIIRFYNSIAHTKENINPTLHTLILRIQNKFKHLLAIRKRIQANEISLEEAFDYYTDLNNNLLELTKGLKLHSSDEKINMTILSLQKLIELKEYAGQERALVAQLVYTLDVSIKDLQQFYTLTYLQNQEIKNIIDLFNDKKLSKLLQEVNDKYKDTFFTYARIKINSYEDKKRLISKIFKEIGYGGMIHKIVLFKRTNNQKYYKQFLQYKTHFDNTIKEYIALSEMTTVEYKTAVKLQHSFDKLVQNPKSEFNELNVFMLYKYLEQQQLRLSPLKWFTMSSNRINDFHKIEATLFDQIETYIEKEEERLKDALIYQVSFTLFVIIFLLAGAYKVSKKIRASLETLDSGLQSFFEFLNFKRELPEQIHIDSNDEIAAMAHKINKQMLLTQQNLEDDKDFIHEATEIVTLMKDGDFTERVYFAPNNPNLNDLKEVLNELINLIATKIKEQTTTLQDLNNSLEDKVYHQTNELHQQVSQLTIARDKAIQAEIAKDEFLANMSHEIRTPLNAILGFVTILKKRIKEEKSVKYLNIIDTSGKSLLTIINDILDFSKIQSGKFTITTHEVEPVEEFSNAVLLFASKAYEKHLIYSVYIDPNMPQSIEIDATRVKQILVNLLSNAIKFTPDDGIVKVRITIKDSDLFISIQDSGIGISKENQSKVFTAFEQADGSTTRKYGGTGLGLSISSKLASLMNGELTLTSEENKGSTFTLKLPIKIINSSTKELINHKQISKYTFAILNKCADCESQSKLIKKYLNDFGVTDILELNEYQDDGYDLLFFVPDDEYNEDIVLSNKPAIAILRTAAIKLANLEHIQPLYAPFAPKLVIEAINEIGLESIKLVSSDIQEPIEEEEEEQFKGIVLVAEDNKTNQMLISLILDDYGLEYDIANNGVEAVSMFKESKYDLVLMDENMPELNGIGAMQQIKEYEKEKKLLFTPIIALTASVLDTDKEMFLNAGMDGFVGKPIDTKELEFVFNRYLEKA